MRERELLLRWLALRDTVLPVEDMDRLYRDTERALGLPPGAFAADDRADLGGEG